MQPERGFDAFLNAAFGPRTTGNVSHFIATTKTGDAAPRSQAGVWFESVQISGIFDERAEAALVRYQLTARVLDPNNAAGAPLLTPPAASASGDSPATFLCSSLTDGVSTTYDGVSFFRLRLNNNLAVQPSVRDPVNRIAAGCTPGMLTGTLELRQLSGAATPLPRTDGLYGFKLRLPGGDATQALNICVSTSYDEDGLRAAAGHAHQHRRDVLPVRRERDHARLRLHRGVRFGLGSAVQTVADIQHFHHGFDDPRVEVCARQGNSDVGANPVLRPRLSIGTLGSQRIPDASPR